MTFVIISDDGLESHELHIHVSRAIGIFVVRICGKRGQAWTIRANEQSHSWRPGLSSTKFNQFELKQDIKQFNFCDCKTLDFNPAMFSRLNMDVRALAQKQASSLLHTCSFLNSIKLKLSVSFATDCSEIDLTTSQRVLPHQRHTPASLYIAPTLTLDSVVKVPLSLHRLLGHDLKQVVGVGDDLCAECKISFPSTHQYAV